LSASALRLDDDGQVLTIIKALPKARTMRALFFPFLNNAAVAPDFRVIYPHKEDE
jgi:hypothetical protein